MLEIPVEPHRVVAPCVNVTVPVGSTVPDGGFTVAVKVTAWLTDEETGSDDTKVVMAAVLPTVTVSGADVTGPVKFASPE